MDTVVYFFLYRNRKDAKLRKVILFGDIAYRRFLSRIVREKLHVEWQRELQLSPQQVRVLALLSQDPALSADERKNNVLAIVDLVFQSVRAGAALERKSRHFEGAEWELDEIERNLEPETLTNQPPLPRTYTYTDKGALPPEIEVLSTSLRRRQPSVVPGCAEDAKLGRYVIVLPSGDSESFKA